MAFSREILTSLLSLQEKDSSLDHLAAEIAKVPAEIKTLRDALAAEKALLDTVKGRIAEFEKRKKEHELDLASKEEAVRKHQKDLNQIKTNDAFKALQHEIDNARAEGNAIETKILEIMEQLDACRGEDKKVQGELKALEGKASAEIGALETKLKVLEARHAQEKTVRDEASASIDPDVLKAYGHIRSRGKLDAIVPVRDGSCGSCQMRLSPHVVVEATKIKSLVFCESCQRLIYRPEALAAPGVAGAAVPPPPGWESGLAAKPKDDAAPISETAGGPLPDAEGRDSSRRQGEELPNSTERGAC